MSSAPWWFVLVTAVVTGVFALSGVWLTARIGLRRQREEQAHAMTLAREKELYDRRVDLHLELIPLVDQVMDILPQGWEDLEGKDLDLEPAEVSLLKDILAQLRLLRLKADAISSKAVRTLLAEMTSEFAGVLRSPETFAFTDLHSIANHLVWEMRIELGVTTREDHEEFEARARYGPEG